MPIGKIVKLVHLSHQTYQPTSRLIPSHNDTGYGTIRSEGGGDIYFSHDAVPGRRGFDDLSRGQTVEYALDPASESIAKLVYGTSDSAKCQGLNIDTNEEGVTHFRYVARTFKRPLPHPSISHDPLDGYPRGN